MPGHPRFESWDDAVEKSKAKLGARGRNASASSKRAADQREPTARSSKQQVTPLILLPIIASIATAAAMVWWMNTDGKRPTQRIVEIAGPAGKPEALRSSLEAWQGA